MGTNPSGDAATVAERLADAVSTEFVNDAVAGHTGDTSDAHDASAVSVTGLSSLEGDSVQEVLADLDTRVPAVESSRVFFGSEEEIRPLIDALPPGTEYRWDKTDGAGVFIDWITGVTDA